MRQCNAVDQDTFFVEDDEGPRRVEGIDSLLQAFEQIESSRQSSINKFLRGSELDGPVYAMHSTCMDIAEHARRYRFFRGAHPEPSTNAVLQNFYGSLKRLHYRIASQSHSVRWEHGYYGAARFWRNFWGQERGWEVSAISLPSQHPVSTIYLDFSASDRVLIPRPTVALRRPRQHPRADGMGPDAAAPGIG